MAMLEAYRSDEDSRRQWRRVPVRFAMRCKRLGRGEYEMGVEAMNLSPGGVRLRAPDRLITGDIVLCWTDTDGGDTAIGFKGLVVQARPGPNGMSDAHVAWTTLSGESREELGRLLRQHDATGADLAPGPGTD
ncbi:MAG: PilZ domain-containing protein [Actinomycetota bacterium]